MRDTVTVKITADLHARAVADLRRRHAFAYERVGFFLAKIGNRGGKHLQVFLTDYIPVPDECYLEDSGVGARIDSAAIRMAMQRVLDTGNGVFHVHLHDWNGKPGFSWTDRCEIPPIVESCRRLAVTAAHGMLVLSNDKADCLVWKPSNSEPVVPDRISVVGHPLRFLES